MSPRMPAELRVLRDLFELRDPAPVRVRDAAYAAAGLARARSGAAALELVGDSADAAAAVRSGGAAPDPAEPRVLTFLMPGRIVELDLVPTVPGLFRAAGMVISRSGQGRPEGDVLFRHPGGQCVAELDVAGAFRVTDVPTGPLGLVFRPVGAAPAVADWLVC
ncbi:hypothetical protein [Saccharopolyspora sp. 7B]|uniref:hypothetical protein n=1 Tax=Saccharopolyspora sp. 7B TaxID=2877240 RepID=UPI001CD590B8|nr:hypothetical protein [Saccharopolyspora sp. 7B]MCA1283492.1 hypothetical protein [Saccharopolyspora sp. 7B]